ncbi:hypothetical protein GOV04_01295 [Candidatus Woesearchaeota archaeon]|nr:hypothetical protein [Candidatus Woesearchaeota archaeon]
MGLKETALTFGVAILFALLVGFGIDAFYESPDYNDYCKRDITAKPLGLNREDLANCPQLDETFIDNCYDDEGMIRYNTDTDGCQTIKECDYCQRDYNTANKLYNRNLLWITAVIGAIALLIGMYAPLTYEPIASGFIFGGVLTIAYGTMRSFSDLSKITRFLILLIELTLLIWLGTKKVLDKPTTKKKK